MTNSSIGQATFIILIFIILILINVMYINKSSLASHWSNFECSQLYTKSLFGTPNSSNAFANCIQNIQDNNFVSFSKTNHETININNKIMKKTTSANKGLDIGTSKNTQMVATQANLNTAKLSQNDVISDIRTHIQTERTSTNSALGQDFSSNLFNGNATLNETGTEFSSIQAIIKKLGLGKVDSLGSAFQAIKDIGKL